ncbi:MAG: hypothetical protein KDA57_19260 [Planctomycetales bacterium]|nr:hypothetical protein [Planctomycetales bacterium]
MLDQLVDLLALAGVKVQRLPGLWLHEDVNDAEGTGLRQHFQVLFEVLLIERAASLCQTHPRQHNRCQSQNRLCHDLT